MFWVANQVWLLIPCTPFALYHRSEDESVYMSSEGSQRGASMDDIGSGLFDSPAGRSISMMPGELASSACQGYPSAHAEMRQRTFAWNVEAAVPRDRIRTLVEIKRRRETHDHSMAVQASRGAVDADIGERALVRCAMRSIPYHAMRCDAIHALCRAGRYSRTTTTTTSS